MTNKRIFLFFLTFVFFFGKAFAQESTSVFNFLNLPVSSHSTALGGKNTSLIEDDISLAAQNPALLSGVTDKTIGLGFLTYMKGSKAGSASYAQMAGERGTWGVHAQFVGYGSIKETNENGESTGSFSPLDFCMTGQYSYELTDHLVGGASGKIIYSHYGEFTSCALAVDLGLNYFTEEKDFSISAVAKNIGTQVKKFGNKHERLPFDMEVGITKGFGHAPISMSVTLVDLTRWNSDQYYSPKGKVGKGKIITNHIIAGVDITPMSLFYVSAGYNFRRAFEMKAAGSSHAAGLSFGAGVNLQKIKVGMSYAKYHVGAPTLAFNVAYNLQKKTRN